MTSNGSLLSLKRGVEVRRHGEDIVLGGPRGKGLRLGNADESVTALVERLANDGGSRDELCDAAARGHQGADYARLYFILDGLGARGLLRYTLVSHGRRLASLESAGPSCRLDRSAGGTFRLSRFAYSRRVGSETVLECPLGAAVVCLHDARAAVAIASLAEPRTAEEIGVVLGVKPGEALAFVSLLASAKAVFPCDTDGRIAEDDSVPLRQWEFHDLLFHARSRLRRHDAPFGGTFRFAGELPHIPAVKAPMSERRIALHAPDLAALDAGDLPFSRVLEARRSIRTAGERPIAAAQLGEFLYRVARVKAMHPADPNNAHSYEASSRPCAGGGAMHEIELYLTIHRCEGIEPGLYHYAPLAHALEHLADLGELQQRLLADACGSAGLQSPPDVLITLAARFQRMAWKYQSMAYAVMLKNAGVLYQQMYLVATAMQLAPCGLGGGDSDAFAEAAGLDYYTETSVGEFMLSSLD